MMRRILPLLLFCAVTGYASAQLNFDPVVQGLLGEVIAQQAIEIATLIEELDFLREAYEIIDVDLIKNIIEGNLDQIMIDTMQMLQEQEMLQDFFLLMEEIENVSATVGEKLEMLSDMKAMLHDLNVLQFIEDKTEQALQQVSSLEWISEQLGSRDSLVGQTQLLNINMLEMNAQLTEIIQATQLEQQLQQAKEMLLKKEEEVIEEAMDRFWNFKW